MVCFLNSLGGCIALWLLVLPAQAAIADDVSIPVFRELRFSRDSIAVVFPHGAYKIGRKPGVAEPIDFQTFRTEFPPDQSTKIEASDVYAEDSDSRRSRWVLPNGTVFESRAGYCGEGDGAPPFLFSKNGLSWDGVFGDCEKVSALAVVQQHLWLGSVSPGEMGDGPGIGVNILSLRDGRFIKQLLAKQDLADGFVQLIQVDPIRHDVWIATRTALHRVRQLKVVGRWYVSEQFSAKGKLTYEFSSNPRVSSPWAILARVTGIIDPTNTVWKYLQDQPKLLDRLRFAYDEEGHFFSVDGVKLERNYRQGDELPSSLPRAWPNDFNWLMDALVSTLRQTSSNNGAELPDTTYMALKQLCFFKDQRVVPFVLEWQRKHPSSSNLEWAVNQCLGLQRQLFVRL